MLAFALADAAKIETQRRPFFFPYRREHRVHDVIVHRAAVQRMRMAYDGTAHRLEPLRFGEEPFER
jgi:hypothetical protein